MEEDWGVYGDARESEKCHQKDGSKEVWAEGCLHGNGGVEEDIEEVLLLS